MYFGVNWLFNPCCLFFFFISCSPFPFLQTGFLPLSPPLPPLPSSCPSSCHILTEFTLDTDNNSDNTHYLQQRTPFSYPASPACSFFFFYLSSHSFCHPATPCLRRSRDAAVEVEREHQAQRHYEETRPVTVCVSSPQFNYYQPYLFTLDVCNCLPSVEQELGWGDLFCGVCSLPCSRVILHAI